MIDHEVIERNQKQSLTRRSFLTGMIGAAGVATCMPSSFAMADTRGDARLKSSFRLAVITDELSQDFDRACSIAANDFHLSWVEIREMWGKSASVLTADETANAQRILAKYSLRVTDFASPLFKVNWKGAPVSPHGPKLNEAEIVELFDAQSEVLDRSISIAKAFGTDRIRCFDFYRIPDQKPYREAIDAKLREAAARAHKEGLMLLLENEPACNTATGAEALAVLSAVPDPNFMINWDPGNAGAMGVENVFPEDFNKIPFHRIGHCHCKDVGPKASGGYEWRPVGKGTLDWVGQFKAFQKYGYQYGVSMETHWNGSGGPEASTRTSIAGMFDALRRAGCLES